MVTITRDIDIRHERERVARGCRYLHEGIKCIGDELLEAFWSRIFHFLSVSFILGSLALRSI